MLFCRCLSMEWDELYRNIGPIDLLCLNKAPEFSAIVQKHQNLRLFWSASRFLDPSWIFASSPKHCFQCQFTNWSKIHCYTRQLKQIWLAYQASRSCKLMVIWNCLQYKSLTRNRKKSHQAPLDRNFVSTCINIYFKNHCKKQKY